MDKNGLLVNLGQLVRSQTYQSYKGKVFKKDLRRQKKNIQAIANGLGIAIYDKEMLELFLEMNAQDISASLICETLKLKYN